VISPGHSSGSAIRSTAAAERLQAGSSSSDTPQGYEARAGEDKAPIARPVGEVFPLSPQEIARDRHADLLREATRERLAASIREGTEAEWPLRVHAGALRLPAGVGRGLTRRLAVRTA
jgi:hypothetical protein